MTMLHLQAVQRPAPAARPAVPSASRGSRVLPDVLCNLVVGALDDLSRLLVSAGVSANAITGACIALGAAAGVLLGLGYFGLAGLVMIVASLGDALDGLVARRSGTVSVAGALLDASGDRYQEFFFLGGLAVYFRASPAALVGTLLALVGSFMVSYGSAKAEAFGVPVPPGVMRRAERAVCLCLATVLMVPWSWFVASAPLPSWSATLPLLIAISLIAVIGNASAVLRLWTLGHAISTSAVARPKANAPQRSETYLSPEPLRLKASERSARP
jgi:CDP-diacylglycerol---glycerol-3-phosphate 3-phosphatidyltransferase